MNEPVNRNDRQQKRINQRQIRILDAAAQVFIEKGYHNASIRDIAEAAQVADGTIYNYFANKEALLLALFERLINVEQTGLVLQAAQDDDLNAMIAGYFGVHLAKVRAHYDLFRAVIPEILATPGLRQQYYERFAAPLLSIAELHLQNRMTQGQMIQTNANQMAHLLYALFFGLLCLRILGAEEIQPSEAGDTALLQTIGTLFRNLWVV